MELEQLATDHGIPFIGEGDRDKHARAGWLQFLCPWCESGKYHLGYCISENYFHCWSCGWHKRWDTLGALLGVGWKEAKRIALKYPGENGENWAYPPERTERPLEATLPPHWGPPTDRHLSWLSRRGFVRPSRIVKRWGLLGTPNAGRYRNRIVAPVWRNGRLVTWQSRSVEAGVSPPYLACPPSDEARPIRKTLYGDWRVTGESVLVVEGVVDAWKMSEASFPVVATWGSAWNDAQVQLLREYRDVLVLFDGGENEAWAKAQALAHTLSVLGVHAASVGMEDSIDPGEFSKSDLEDLWGFLENVD